MAQVAAVADLWGAEDPGYADGELAGSPIEFIAQPTGEFIQETEVPWMQPPIPQGQQSIAHFDVRDEGVHEETSFHGGFGYQRQGSRLGRYLQGTADCRTPGEVKAGPKVTSITGPNSGSGDIRQFLTEFNSKVYAAVGAKLEVSSDGGATWADASSLPSFGTDITSLAVFRGIQSKDYLYIGLGNGTAYYAYDGTTFTVYAGDEPLPTNVQQTTDTGANYTDVTTNVTDGAAGTVMAINSYGTHAAGDWVYIGYTTKFEKIRIKVSNTNGNAVTMVLSYPNNANDPSSFGTASIGSDATASGGATLAQNGLVTFTKPADWVQQAYPNSGGVKGYYMRMSFSGALDSSVSIAQINVVRETQAERFWVVGNALYRSFNNNTVLITEEGGTAPLYGAQLTVGDGDEAINGGYSVSEATQTGEQERVYMVKPSGMYTTTATGTQTVERVVTFNPTNSNNGLGGTVWHVNKALYIPIGNGLRQLQNSSLRPMGPELHGANTSAVRGEITAVAGDSYYLYAAVQNASGASYVMSWGAYEPQPDGSTQFLPVWHVIASLGSVTVRTMLVTSEDTGANPRLLCGSNADLKYILVSNESPNWRLDAGGQVASASTLDLSNLSLVFEAELKALLSFSTVSEGWNIASGSAINLNAAGDVAIAYRLSPQDDFTTLATWSADADAVRQDFSSNLSGRAVDIRITLTADSATVTPVLRTSALHYAVRTKFKRRFSFQCRRPVWTRDGSATELTEAQYYADLKSARETGTAVALKTPFDETVLVIVRQLNRTAYAHFRATSSGTAVEGGNPSELRALDDLADPDDISTIYSVVASEYRVSGTAGTIEALASYTIGALAGRTIGSLEEV